MVLPDGCRFFFFFLLKVEMKMNKIRKGKTERERSGIKVIGNKKTRLQWKEGIKTHVNERIQAPTKPSETELFFQHCLFGA